MKSNGPLKYSRADIFGLIVACCSKLTVNLAWGKMRSQRYGGNAASTPERMERKWFLKCQIICSALFLQFKSSGTSWNLVFHNSVMTHLKSALALLSLILRSTKSPRAANCAIMALKAGMRCLSAFSWKTCCKIRFPSVWYAIITHWLPKRAKGNCPMSSVYSLLFG